MGVLSRLLGWSSSNDSRKDTQNENIPVTQYFFIGNEIQSAPLRESMVILRQGAPEDEEPRGDNWEWSVVKCNEAIEVPQDTDVKICVYREGSVITANDTFQSQMAWLLSPEEIEALQNNDKVTRSFPFPNNLRGETIPVGTRWNQKDLESLILSFNI
jgi:hypothetical protein